jgi:DNA-binding NarL/FixJ family response regulator
MVRGLGNKKIAEINGSAPATVKLHRSRVLEKFGCKNLSELIAMSFDGNGKLYEFLGQSE